MDGGTKCEGSRTKEIRMKLYFTRRLCFEKQTLPVVAGIFQFFSIPQNYFLF
jgi:hypothetical protein